MGHRSWGPIVVSAICAAAFALLYTGGCSSLTSGSADEASCHEDPDCVQPPLRRAELPEYLKRHQDRIMARDDYKDDLPPPVSQIIYGPLPDGHHRPGPKVVDRNGNTYEGPLNWHHIDFQKVHTDNVDHDSMQGRDVSGAHCLFARRPNRLTPLFAILALHHPDRGDVLYYGGPHQHVTRIDTVPLTDRHAGRLQIDTDAGIDCVFRDDQNQYGAVVVPYRNGDGSTESDSTRFAAFSFILGDKPLKTGETTTVPRAGGLHGDNLVQVEVPERKYPRPRIEFIDSFTTRYKAIEAVDDRLDEGDFRLRPEFVYPVMPYQSYLDTGKEEFCPVHVDCETPPEHMNKDVVPPVEMPEETGDETAENTDE